METGWWKNQNPQSLAGGTQQQQPPNQQQPPAQQEERLPQTKAELLQMMAEERRKETEAYNTFASDYQKTLTGLSQQFLKTEYAEYMPLAMKQFEIIQGANPAMPPQAIYDKVVEVVAGMKQMGIKPPPSPSNGQPFTGVPGGNQQNGIPLLGDSRFRGDEQGGVRNSISFYSDEARSEDAQNQMNAAKRDRMFRMSRGEEGQQAKDYFTELTTVKK